MQAPTVNPQSKRPPDAAFGAFLFALGVALFGLLLEFLNLSWLITLLMGFTSGLLIAGGLYLITKEAYIRRER